MAGRERGAGDANSARQDCCDGTAGAGDIAGGVINWKNKGHFDGLLRGDRGALTPSSTGDTTQRRTAQRLSAALNGVVDATVMESGAKAVVEGGSGGGEVLQHDTNRERDDKNTEPAQ